MCFLVNCLGCPIQGKKAIEARSGLAGVGLSSEQDVNGESTNGMGVSQPLLLQVVNPVAEGVDDVEQLLAGQAVDRHALEAANAGVAGQELTSGRNHRASRHIRGR